MFLRCLIWLCLLLGSAAYAQQRYELGGDWLAVHESRLSATREELSVWRRPANNVLQAVVPGTILSTLQYNGKIPNPLFGMNNERIPDLYVGGWQMYTFWYLKDFIETAAPGEQVFLQLRGINYTAEVYLNGHKVNKDTVQGMYLRHSFEITNMLATDGHNRLAILVYPPYEAGKPNGGQGGDGTIAKCVTNQYVAGWDWIQPVRDRNTGIWDKVFIEKVKNVNVKDVHVRTEGTGEAKVYVTAMVEEVAGNAVKGELKCVIGDVSSAETLKLQPFEKKLVRLPVMTINNPKLWWPNGMGEQEVYNVTVRFVSNKKLCDEEKTQIGIRDITTKWNTNTQSREIWVNGKRMFVKGANWILTDAMLQFSKEKYDAEVRYHRDMNLNMIRVWGGGITERPEFYEACDKYGLLVFQDFWASGDCNGRWHDPLKRDDTNTRQQYPDNHKLWLACAGDQIKMLRNHPSLAIWCGGNEIRPPKDILEALKDSLNRLDGKRYFFEYSNHDSMSLRAHDGPYTIQKDSYFWEHKSWGWNSEVGSVGIGDIESLKRFIPEKNLVPPYYDTTQRKWVIDSVWRYHKYCSYDSSVEAYGHPEDAKQFAWQAQLVNYNQYRALMEGIRSHMWDWYTGVLEWKTQNPWTAMVGQMYDVYLDPNACMFGMKTGAKPLHVMYNPVRKSIMVVNDDHEERRVTVTYKYITSSKNLMDNTLFDGSYKSAFTVPADTCIEISQLAESEQYKAGAFLDVSITDKANDYADHNLYWLADNKGSYKWLQDLFPEGINMGVKAKNTGEGKVRLQLKYTGKSIAFFNHISVVDKKTKARLLPVFCSDNYVSLYEQREEQTIDIEFTPNKDAEPMICIEGWNTGKRYVEIEK